MRKTKLTGTRYQPRALYAFACCALILSTAIGVCKELKINLLAELSSPFHKDPPIQWRSQSEAFSECVRAKKPLLYVFLVRGEDVSLKLENEALNTPCVYNYINQNYIPVKYSCRPNSVLPHLPRNLSDSASQLNWPNAGSMLVVPYKMSDAGLPDILSSANPVELGCQDHYKGSNYYNGYDEYSGHYYQYNRPLLRNRPLLQDYRDINDLMSYLYLGKIWHTLPPTKGLVHWQSPAVLDKAPTGKPRVVYMLEEFGSSSDEMRMRQFFDSGLTNMLNDEFTPVLLQFAKDDPLNAKLAAYKQRYGVSSLPAVVVVDSKSGQPEVQRGYTDPSVMTSFLREGVSRVGLPHRNIKILK
jgi:hypothetical protein